MKIVVIDSATLNPGDLSWSPLEGLGDCAFYPRSSPSEVVPRCRQAEVVVTNKVPFDSDSIESLPNLRCISVSATGYNMVDTAAAAARNIIVTNVPVYGTPSVSQMAFALLLELTQRVGHHDRTVHEGRWVANDNFSYWDYPLIELSGLTMGIVGCGRIGAATANIARAFGMKVIAYDPHLTESPAAEIKMLDDLDDLLSRSDIVSLHCPLTADNEGFINAARLAHMKKSALLINTSRGPIINETDLAHALNHEQIAGAGLDVLSVEPPNADNPLLTAKNCVITPHIAWASRACRHRLLTGSIENVKAFLAGNPTNVVN